MTHRRLVLPAVLLGIAAATGGAQAPQREITITFDDLPLATRVYVADVAEQRRITDRLLAAVVRHGVPAIGFVNEGKLAPGGRVDPRRVDLLRAWVAAGLELGNHSYSHFDLHTTPLERYQPDVARGDSATRRILADAKRPPPSWFRHPFLHTGRDSATRATFERSLATRGYRVAPVTFDNYDYIFAAAYEQTLAAGNRPRADTIASEYIKYMTDIAAYYEQQSTALFGREIRQVLLLHANRLNADHFDALARMLEGRGYRFLPLARAVADSAYRSPDTYYGPAGITWIHRWALTQGKRGAFFAGEPVVPAWIEKAAES